MTHMLQVKDSRKYSSARAANGRVGGSLVPATFLKTASWLGPTLNHLWTPCRGVSLSNDVQPTRNKPLAPRHGLRGVSGASFGTRIGQHIRGEFRASRPSPQFPLSV